MLSGSSFFIHPLFIYLFFINTNDSLNYKGYVGLLYELLFEIFFSWVFIDEDNSF